MYIPKYKEIQNYIVSLIEKGELTPGNKINDEEYFADRFDVSKLTARRAIVNLSESGYIKRIPGKGSFISDNLPYEIKQTQKFSSLSEDIRATGKEPGSKLIHYSVETLDEDSIIFKNLQLEKGDLVHKFSRVRYADSVPIAYAIAYIPLKIIANMDLEELNSGSLMKYLYSMNIPSTEYSKIDLVAIIPDLFISNSLEISGEPVILNKQISFTENNTPYKYVETFYVTSRFDYKYISYTSLKRD